MGMPVDREKGHGVSTPLIWASTILTVKFKGKDRARDASRVNTARKALARAHRYGPSLAPS